MLERVCTDAEMAEREVIWRSLFGDRPMPVPQPDTVEKAAGSLGREFHITDEAIEDGLAELEQ